MTIPVSDTPITLFAEWLKAAESTEVNDANAVCLATADADGMPSARMVLLKQADDDGFVFFTNVESRKGTELQANPQAALCFHWKSVRRQVRVQGRVAPVADEEADAYFATRNRQSQIGAWASSQSRPLEGRFELERRVAEVAARYGISKIPRPPHWSGFRLTPVRIEFWENRPFRLHERLLYERGETGWTTSRLFP
ncbi:MAG: pyridoxamine 5'-phosphate oxidase [Rhodospirillaceae bacterium]|mgnify:CR=1 FL=1|nr:pyridoxamine 5'-phosphate oxidase [Rhodospirillaceae bacterium]